MKLTTIIKKSLLIFCVLLLSFQAAADITLIGDNAPFNNVNDGNFDLIPGWQVHHSPHWHVKQQLSKGERTAGVAKGVFTTSGNDLVVVESAPLNNIAAYEQPKKGDEIVFSFTAKAEHKANAFISMGLTFGETVNELVSSRPLSGGPEADTVISGSYTVTAEDEKAGVLAIRFKLRSENYVSIFLKEVNLRVKNKATAGPKNLTAKPDNNQVVLTWQADKKSLFNIYRKSEKQKTYQPLVRNISANTFTDNQIIHGVEYTYLVNKTLGKGESSAAYVNNVFINDAIKPSVVSNIKANAGDTEIQLTWQKTDKDIEHYIVYRGDENAKNRRVLNSKVSTTSFIDDLPQKGELNSYFIQAVDYSGNKSELSKAIFAKVNAVYGASFSDLIKPIPIHQALSDNLWGADNVLPRDPHNGIEHPAWSYWGGNPTKGKDGKYHMLVVRWPENGPRGHWEWPDSTVVHSVAEKPTGPYIPTGEIAYPYANGKGHNADVLTLNDGRFLLYSLINWKPTLLTAEKMKGPWQVEGEMVVEYDAEKLKDKREYQVQRNLSGVQLEDGSMLFVSKFGRMIKSDSGLLGPYKVLTGTINENETIPKRYRQSNYEDPVMWRDDVQFHLIINAFLDYRAIYLRSPDGIHWHYDAGLAYTPDNVSYEDGTRTHWYKLERPHVLQDEYGRATHLSVAVIDTIKRQDFSNDKHSSKNIIIPLTVHKRAQVLHNSLIGNKNQTLKNKTIEILIHSEKDFNALTDIDISSLRYGSADTVNFGGGAKVLSKKAQGNDLFVTFANENTNFNEQDFVGKLLGKLKNGDLFIAFTRLK